jgi:hypothetical protein
MMLCQRQDDGGFFPKPSLRGALATKQSSLSLFLLDCFASLAMTLKIHNLSG